MNDTKTQIMDIAENAIRSGGFGAFSFRVIADQLGIKSSSVHYHFRSKDDLGTAVAKRYRQRFLEALGDPEAEDSLRRFADLFVTAFEANDQVCLCGVLAGESGSLADPIREELLVFSTECRAWLTTAFESGGQTNAERRALTLFSALEGAMIFASVSGDSKEIKAVADELL